MKKKNPLIHKIVIIGSGPAGYTSAIYAARANLNPLLITGLNKGGQLTKTTNIENWPGTFNNISGIKLMENMENHVKFFNTNVVFDQVLKIKISKNIIELNCEKNKYFSYSIIIATGSSPRYLNIQSEKKFLGKGISTCATCDGFFYKNKDVAVVGGGNTAVEEALYLSKIVNVVYLIHRREKFTAEKILMNQLYKKIKLKKIILYTNYTITNIFDTKPQLSEIEISHTNNENLKKILFISGLFIAIGNIPNTKIFKNIIDMDNEYIKVYKHNSHSSTQTNIPNIFAAGDVVDHVYKQAITASASGCMAAIDAEKYLNTLNLIN
ncbi:thioredoxin-disulfide reductase [Buchnera aphidicola]|uniref:thioredoxin-disulfide reductase n=1 Tax=Buchnera aphidicola TaxID=9 RepID=UPI003463B0EE